MSDQIHDILDRYGRSLTRVALSYTRSSHDHEDLLQDIVLAIWQGLPRFERRSSLRTFIFRIAHNRGLHHLHRRRTRELDRLTRESEEADRSPGPQETIEEGLGVQRLLLEIRRLPLGQRQVMTLHLEGLAHAEIGEVLGISEANAAVRLHRARATLRKGLGEDNG